MTKTPAASVCVSKDMPSSPDARTVTVVPVVNKRSDAMFNSGILSITISGRRLGVSASTAHKPFAPSASQPIRCSVLAATLPQSTVSQPPSRTSAA